LKKIILVIAIILSFQTESKAGFAHAGTTITQSLVDDDLTNLGSLTGVVTTVTAGAGGRIFTTYDIGNNKLLINGTLTR